MSDLYNIRVQLVERYRGVEYWYAWDDLRFDADHDGEGYVPNYAQASSHTKWGAIEALIEQLREAEEGA
jgi:hypothetical protein